ncbi:MAG: DNA polymerase III subunit gamma/tau [Clostridia bacterium]|nr:DNA polymerase III subunit gamma/tau [Clostridia bacterium]
MAHLALYRMFRPTTLDDVVRQEHIVTVLKNQINTGKVGHAYLFCGPRGTGKTSIAKIFAAAINCQSPKDGSACGKCEACRALKDPSNLDITEIDAASNNGVNEMRDLREKVQYPPVAGRFKVYIIDEVHMLSTGAFNALLKTLEEPPSHAVFILATTESQKIPATILSRCMRFDFKLIPQADLEARLRHVFDSIGKKYDDEAIAAIARAGAGSVRDMLSVADTCVSYTSGKLTYAHVTAVLGTADFSAVAKLCYSILSGDSGAAFERAEAFLAAGKSVGMLLGDVLNFLNACAVAKTCRDGKSILALPEDMYAEVEKIAKETDGHRLLRVTEIFASVETDLKYSTSPRILFETAVLKASMPQADYDIEALIARITELENKLASGAFVQNEGGVYASNSVSIPKTEAVKPVKKEEIPTEKTEEEEYIPMDFDAPPDEQEMGGNAYFDESIMPVKKPNSSLKTEQKTTASMPVSVTSAPTQAPQAPTPLVAKPAVSGDARTVFGTFLRSVRKTAKNGVLITICMDLDGVFEDGIFVLYTQSETAFRSLTREDHYALIVQAFAAIGMGEGSFEIRLRGKKTDVFNKAVDEIKATFNGVKVEIK